MSIRLCGGWLVSSPRPLTALLTLATLLVPSGFALRSPRALASLTAPPPIAQRQESLNLAAGRLDYQVTAGFVPLAGEGPATASVYYTAYTQTLAPGEPPRPLAIAFNGGPGASSLYLHLLGLAPQRLALDAEGRVLPGSPHLRDNPDTWLAFTDLVFVDPPGTGFSDLGHPHQTERYLDVYGDVQGLREFLRRYLQKTGRQESPLYLVGESYGGTRAVLLAWDQVQEPEFDLQGLILISPVLDYEFLDPRASSNLKLALNLPTWAATARYHARITPTRPWDAWLASIEDWAIRQYLPALVQGDRLTDSQRQTLARQLGRYTGLSSQQFLRQDLRLTTEQFRRVLLAGRQLDRWDSRLTYTTIPPSEHMEGAMLEAWSNYAREHLGLPGDYVLFSRRVNQSWRWGNQPFNLDLAPQLGETLRRRPGLRLFVAAGYYDLVVPFAAVHYSLNRLNLPPQQHETQVHLRYYAAGHMVYLPDRERQRLQQEVAAFMAAATAGGDRPTLLLPPASP